MPLVGEGCPAAVTTATAPGWSIAIDDHPLEFEAQPARHRMVVDIVIGENGAETIADIDRDALADVEGDAARQRRRDTVLVMAESRLTNPQPTPAPT